MKERFLAALRGLGWSSRQWVLFLPFMVAFLFAFAVALYAGISVSDTVLFLTGVVILVYTVETQGLRLEMVRQNEMTVQPVIIVTIDTKWMQEIAPTGRDRVVLKNIGRGPALFIKVGEVELNQVPRGRLVAKFDTIDYLEPGKDAVVVATWRGEFETGSSQPQDFTSNLNPQFASESYEVNVFYEDINGQRLKSVMRMGKDGIRLLRHGHC
jgi:hypothetical protein